MKYFVPASIISTKLVTFREGSGFIINAYIAIRHVEESGVV